MLKNRNRVNQNYVENTIDFAPPSPHTAQKPINLVPRSRNQEALILSLSDQEQPIVVTIGPAGTGKTYLAMQAAVRALRTGECDRIIMTRPAVAVEDERHGFLPGNLVAKMEPWTRPLLDVLRQYYRAPDITRMIDEQTIEISPLAYMRGRTFRKAWVIADEMQNATPAQVKMLMTRIGTHSKIVITGAASGMGRHFALRIAEAGGQVAAGDVNTDGLESLKEETKGKPGAVHVRRLDVASDGDAEAFVEFGNGLANFAVRVLRAHARSQNPGPTGS